MARETERSIEELYRDDPERADAIAFGRETGAHAADRAFGPATDGGAWLFVHPGPGVFPRGRGDELAGKPAIDLRVADRLSAEFRATLRVVADLAQRWPRDRP